MWLLSVDVLLFLLWTGKLGLHHFQFTKQLTLNVFQAAATIGCLVESLEIAKGISISWFQGNGKEMTALPLNYKSLVPDVSISLGTRWVSSWLTFAKGNSFAANTLIIQDWRLMSSSGNWPGQTSIFLQRSLQAFRAASSGGGRENYLQQNHKADCLSKYFLPAILYYYCCYRSVRLSLCVCSESMDTQVQQHICTVILVWRSEDSSVESVVCPLSLCEVWVTIASDTVLWHLSLMI